MSEHEILLPPVTTAISDHRRRFDAEGAALL